jgi:hypothetical protein
MGELDCAVNDDSDRCRKRERAVSRLGGVCCQLALTAQSRVE